MRVLIIYPPNQLMPIETPRPDGSLGPLYLCGALREIGVEADLIDSSVGTSKDDLKDTFYRNESLPNGLIRIGMSKERIAEAISKGYDLVCVHSNFTPQTKMAFEIAEIARRVLPDCTIISGGINARNLTDRFFQTGLFELICSTEGETVIKNVVKRLSRKESLKGIAGTVYRGGTSFMPDPVLVNLDKLPFPAWDKLPFDKYDTIDSPHGIDLNTRKDRYAPIMTSRGCPFKCAYCHISLEKGSMGDLRLKSVDRVLQEIEILRNLGVNKLFIEDDSLLAKKGRIKELFTNILNMGLSIAGVNGVNLVHFFQKVGSKLEPDREYMELLFNAGFKQIVFPVESGSQRILDKYATAKLKLPIMDVLNLTKIAVDIGIMCPVNMMIGFPDETEEEMMASVELAKKLMDCGTPYVTFFIPIPFPGSQLYHMAIAGGYLKADFDPDIMNWKNGVLENTLVPRERIVEIRDWAWETVNTKSHTEKRIKESMKTRIAN